MQKKWQDGVYSYLKEYLEILGLSAHELCCNNRQGFPLQSALSVPLRKRTVTSVLSIMY